MKKSLSLIALLLVLVLAGCTSTPTSNAPVEGNVVSQTSSVASPEYPDGTYLVGKDIEPGLYSVTLSGTLMGMAYVERASDVTMELGSILANIILMGDGYATIKDTDVAVKIQGAVLRPINLETLQIDIKTEVEDGMYLVGYDIAPGVYKVEITDTTTKMAYVERLSDASFDLDNIIANSMFQNQGYVEILETDFAVRVQGGKLIME